MEKRTEKSVSIFLQRSLKFFAFASLVTPLIYAEAAVYQATLPRAAFFQVVVELMLVSWIPLALTHPAFRPNWRHPVNIGLAVFISTMLITWPFGIDPLASLFSNFVRMMGVVNILHFAVYILILPTIFHSWKEWRTFFLVNAEIAVVISLYAFYQWLFLGFSAPTGTIGNALYLAGYMIPVFFSIGILYVWEERRAYKTLYPLIGLLIFTAIVLAGRRGSFVGLAFSVVAAGLVYPWFFATKTWIKRGVPVFIIAISLAGSIGLVGLRSSEVAKPWIESHVPREVSRLIYGNVGNRFALWNMTVRGVAERPIAGYGYEQFPVIFHQYFDPNGAHKGLLREFYFDRAHNQYLEVLVASGVIGLAGFLFYLFMVLRTVWQGLKRSEHSQKRLTFLLIGMSVVAYLGSAITMFDTTSQCMMFAVMAAFLVSMSLRFGGQAERPVGQMRWAYILIPMVLFLPFTWYANIRPVIIGREGEAAYRTLQTQHDQAGFNKAVNGFQRALSGRSWMMQKTRIRIIDVVRPYGERIGFRSSEMERLTLFLAGEMDKSAAQHPNDFETLVETSIANRLAAVYEPDRIAQAREAAERAIILGPKEADGYNELAEVALFEGNVDEAMHWEEEALKYAGVYKAEIGRVYFGMARAEAMRGDMNAMQEFLKTAEVEHYPIAQDARLLLILSDREWNRPPSMDVLQYATSVLEGVSGQPYVIAANVRLQHAAGNKKTVQDLLAQLTPLHPDLAVQLFNELQLDVYDGIKKR